jgi:hypothetical protein
VASLRERITSLEGNLKEREDALAKLGAEFEKADNIHKEIINHADIVYTEYKKALALFGAEPLPLPEFAEGGEGVSHLLGWLVSEFEGLGEVMDVAGDNAVSLSLETILGNLISLGCQDVAKLAADDFVFK